MTELLSYISWLYPRGLELSCSDGSADVLALIDPSIAPPLLYYAYLPIIIIVLLTSLFIAVSKTENAQRRHLFWIGILFATLMGIETFLWIAMPVYLVHFAWQIVPVLNALLILLIVAFSHRFFYGEGMPHLYRWVLIFLSLPLFILTPTQFNLVLFDISACESVQSLLWPYMYGLEVFVGIAIFTLSIGSYIRNTGDPARGRFVIFGIGILLFMATKTVGDMIALYSVNFLWPLGMAGFMLLLSYLAIRYNAFNTRIFGAQILIAALAAVIFAALFVRTIENIRYVLVGTLVFVVILGAILIRSVRREVEQKEENFRLAQALGKTNERLKELDQQKSEFLSIATHQLRGPLAAIRGHLSLVLDGSYGTLPEPAHHVIEKVFASGTLMTETVNDFLNVSRIEQGSMQYEMTDFNVGDMIRDISEELQVTAEEKKLQIYVVEPLAQGPVHADYGKIRHIFFNLLDNAIKYTTEGFVRTEVTTTQKGFVRVTIADSGIGIAPEKIHMLFQKFVRMREASGINISGTGLGLYVAKQMVAAHNGNIWAESKGLGKGTTFIVELPLRKEVLHTNTAPLTRGTD